MGIINSLLTAHGKPTFVPDDANWFSSRIEAIRSKDETCEDIEWVLSSKAWNTLKAGSKALDDTRTWHDRIETESEILGYSRWVGHPHGIHVKVTFDPDYKGWAALEVVNGEDGVVPSAQA